MKNISKRILDTTYTFESEGALGEPSRCPTIKSVLPLFVSATADLDVYLSRGHFYSHSFLRGRRRTRNARNVRLHRKERRNREPITDVKVNERNEPSCPHVSTVITISFMSLCSVHFQYKHKIMQSYRALQFSSL